MVQDPPHNILAPYAVLIIPWPGDHALYPTYPFRHHPAPNNVESSSATRQAGVYKQRYTGERS